MRIVTSLIQPLLFLFVLGSGLQPLVARGHPRRRPQDVHLPRRPLHRGDVHGDVLSAASIVWDREFGFLREMMVAPVRRSSIVIGKCLGGATVASFQGVIVLALAGAGRRPLRPAAAPRRLRLCMLLLAFAMTAFGVMVAVRIKQMQTFMGVMQMIVMPMFFISGALYPVTGLPAWLAVLNRLDPLTYAVDPMRRLVFGHLDVCAAARARSTRASPGWAGTCPARSRC